MIITVTYINNDNDINNYIRIYNLFEEIENHNLVLIIDCSNNMLTVLPANMNFPNLQTFNCSHNMLTVLPANMNFPNLEYFHCSNNMLKVLPANMNFRNLQKIWCYNNKLRVLPANMNFPNLQVLYCSNNELRVLPENMNFPNLQIFYCDYNMLTKLPANMFFPNLKLFQCEYNKLTFLPVCILNFKNLNRISYHNNEIELSPQIARFINRIENWSITKLNVYNDTQNIHNSNIQLSVKDSINRITTRTDLQKYSLEQLNVLIVENKILTDKSKSLLLEYSNDESVHSLLLLTFSEVLWFIIQTIITDFDYKEQDEIFKILNQEITDTECKCFTGRMNRIINCLNGFSPLISINIKDSDQIGNIIIMIKNKLDLTNSYTIEEHKEQVEKELLERGYDISTIKLWLEYID
jgi:hypothetical protein